MIITTIIAISVAIIALAIIAAVGFLAGFWLGSSVTEELHEPEMHRGEQQMFALLEIAAMETDIPNATVRRMAAVARKALAA